MKTKKLLILLITVVALFYSCEYKIPGEHINSTDYQIYYKLNTKEFQTFAFGSSKSFSLALTGQFSCTTNQNKSKYKLTDIAIEPKLISRRKKFKNLEFGIRNIIYKKERDTIKFYYDLYLIKDGKAPYKTKVVHLEKLDSISKGQQLNISFELIKNRDSTDIKILNDIEEWEKMIKRTTIVGSKINEKRDPIQIMAFAGGGYECNGIGFIGVD